LHSVGKLVLKIANISPDEAFVEGIFGVVAVDLVGADCFYFAVGVKNMDDVTADEGQRIFLTNVRISDRKVRFFHVHRPDCVCSAFPCIYIIFDLRHFLCDSTNVGV
jgi:hypothetical protein